MLKGHFIFYWQIHICGVGLEALRYPNHIYKFAVELLNSLELLGNQ